MGIKGKQLYHPAGLPPAISFLGGRGDKAKIEILQLYLDG